MYLLFLSGITFQICSLSLGLCFCNLFVFLEFKRPHNLGLKCTIHTYFEMNNRTGIFLNCGRFFTTPSLRNCYYFRSGCWWAGRVTTRCGGSPSWAAAGPRWSGGRRAGSSGSTRGCASSSSRSGQPRLAETPECWNKIVVKLYKSLQIHINNLQ